MVAGRRKINPDLSEAAEKMVGELAEIKDLVRLEAIAVMAHKLGEFIGGDAVTDILKNMEEHYREYIADFNKRYAALKDA